MAKTLVERCLHFTIYGVRRNGFLHPGMSWTSKWDDGSEIKVRCEFRNDSDLCLVLRYSIDDAAITETVPLGHQFCCVGAAIRWFMHCPHCSRRARVLYKPPMAHRFLCRRCHDLRYRSSLRSRKARRIRRWMGT